MSQVVRTSLNCPRCGQTFPAIIEQIIDVGGDPQAKARFLSGRVNAISCPNCGHAMAIGTPLLYHDPAKELLLVYVPMELNINQQERESVIGDLTRRVTESIPPEKRKAYLLQPRQALTIPGMIDTILESDGITEEMREAQRDKMHMMEMFLSVSQDEWPRLIEEHDGQIDHEFFQMLLVTIENAAETGHRPMAENLLELYNYLIENTAIGREVVQAAQVQEQVVQEVAADLQALGDNATREDFMNLVLSYAGDDERIQAVVGLIRPALDYTFFQDLSGRIEAASGDERERLAGLREQLHELTTMLDKQTQAVIQRATDTLRNIINSEDIEAAIRPRLDQIDDTFLAVLQANVQAAEEHQDTRTADRLRMVLQKTLEILRENAPPQIRFINELMSAESDDDAQALIESVAPRFGPELLELMEAIAQDLDDGDQPAEAERLRAMRDRASAFVAASPSGMQ
jgi:hypothetical protein